MPTLSSQPFTPNFGSQLNIESLIAAPLIAASKANVVMITGQTRALLENCFEQTDGKTYEPVMINMTLTRSFVENGTTNPDGTKSGGSVRVAKLAFSIPLLCLIPINNLVVDKINVDFDLEITSVTHKNTPRALANGAPIMDQKATLNGRVAKKSSKGDADESDSTSRLKVNINASPLPLPLGLLTVLDLYTKSIQPVPPQNTTEPTKENAAE